MKYLLFALFFGATIIVHAQETQKPRADTVLPATAENIRKIDSLLGQLPTATPSQRFDIHFELFGRYRTVDFEKALIFLDSCLAQSARSGDSLWIVKSAHAKGFAMTFQGNIRGGIKICERALVIAKRNGYHDQVKFLLNTLARSYTSLAVYDTALFYNLETLRIREIEGNARDISITLNNIGVLYEELGDLESALTYFRKSYKLKVDSKVSYDLEKVLLNIGVILNQTNKFDEAAKLATKVIHICESGECEQEIIAQSNLVFGTSMVNKKEFELAEKHLSISVAISNKLESLDRVALCYYWLSKLFFTKNATNTALYYLDKSQEFAEKSDLRNRVLNNYFLYSEIYSRRKNYLLAYEYQRKYHELNTRIMNGNLINRLSAIQLDYKERENKVMMESQAEVVRLQKASINQHQLLNLLIGLLTILLAGLVWILLNSNRQKQQINEMLNKRVKERTFELERNRDELQHAHDEQRLVLRKVSGDLVSSLATFKGLSYVAERELPMDKAIYFKEAQATAERVVGYVRQYSSIDEKGEFKNGGTAHLD